MSYYQLDTVQNRHITDQLCDVAVNPTSSALLYLLPPCLVLLAIDVVVRLSQRQTQMPHLASEHDEKIRRLNLQAHHVMRNFQELDKRLVIEGVRSQRLFRMLVKQRNFAHHRRRLADSSHQLVLTNSPDFAAGSSNSPMESDGVGAPFTSFCERLLLQNRIWKQQKEVKTLQKSLDSMKSTSGSNAFQAFCDRLLLSNNIWKLQKEVARLTEETEKLKKSRVAAVTRAAKQMVQDVRKERLTEEFVKDLIAEMEECRQAVVTLRVEHEKEIQELAQEWREDCRKLSREVERLKLAQEARLTEQDLSNQMETELLERLAIREQKAKVLMEELEPHLAGDDSIVYHDDDTETLDGDSDLEEMSNTSTATYVGSAGCSPNAKFTFGDGSKGKEPAYRLRAAQLTPLKMLRHHGSSPSLRNSPSSKTPVRKLDPGPYAGFSFNPLFFGNANIARREDATETGSPVDSIAFTLKSPPTSRKSSSLSKATHEHVSQPAKRAQWRV